MLDIQDTLWKLFESTGQVNYYLMYNAISKENKR